MTKQQHLDEAAKAAGYPDWGSAALMHPTEPLRVLIEKCATTLEALAERDRVLGEIEPVLRWACERLDRHGSAFQNELYERLFPLATLAAPYRVKVDPLVEAMDEVDELCRKHKGPFNKAMGAEMIRKALASRGLEIVAQRGEVK